MKVRYKVLHFGHVVCIGPTDTFTVELIEHDGTTQSYAEEINDYLSISHVCFFRIAGQGIGAVFGTEELISKVRNGELFVDATEVGEDENL